MRSSTVECTKYLFNTTHSTRINARKGQTVRYLALLCSTALPSICFHCCIIEQCIEIVENKQVKNSKLSK